MFEYLPILIFLIMALVISCGAIFMSLVLGKQSSYPEKISPYECGF